MPREAGCGVQVISLYEKSGGLEKNLGFYLLLNGYVVKVMP